MRFNNDFILKHTIWLRAQEFLDPNKLNIFDRLVDIFIISCSIGISQDEWLDDDSSSEIKTIGRNTISQNYDISSLFEFLYQNAILNTKKIKLSPEERKKSAFDDVEISLPVSPKDMLIKFANYGFSKLVECIDSDDLNTLDNIKNLICDMKKSNSNDLFDDIDLD